MRRQFARRLRRTIAVADRRQSFGDIIKFGSAFTLAEGLFDDEKQAAAVTDHKGRQSELNSTTTVTAETREVAVGMKPVVTLKRVRGTLVSRRRPPAAESRRLRRPATPRFKAW